MGKANITTRGNVSDNASLDEIEVEAEPEVDMDLEQAFVTEPSLVPSPESASDHDDTNQSMQVATSYKEEVGEHKNDSPRCEMHVSSAHLSQSSKYFRALLSGSFREASGHSASDSRRIDLDEVPVEPFVILMKILHHRNRSLPKVVSAELLYQLCVMIDMYEMHEATSLWTDQWFANASYQIPQKYSTSLRHWAFICYVLQKEESFKKVTANLQRYFVEGADADEIPLPAKFDGEHSDLGLSPPLTSVY